MIQLRRDCLLFETSSGETIPCSAEVVAIELVGDAASKLDPNIIREAAAAVMHYFKTELGRDHVSIAEFSSALEKVLTEFGLTVTSEDEGTDAGAPLDNALESNLNDLAADAGVELAFFPKLRSEVREKLSHCPATLRFVGLRSCVKSLLGAKRWNSRCQHLSDQIVTYVRECWSHDHHAESCGLIVT